MNKSSSSFVWFGGALVIFWVAKLGLAKLDREPAVSSDLATRAWVEQVLLPGSLTIDVPWPLEHQKLDLPPEVANLTSRMVSLSHEEDGVNVFALVTTFLPGTPANLDGAADGALANMNNVPGTRSIDSSKKESSALGLRAIEIEAKVAREGGAPLLARGIVVVRGQDLIQVMVISLADQSASVKVWERIRDSIRSP